MSVNYRAKLVWGTELTFAERNIIVERNNELENDIFAVDHYRDDSPYILGIPVAAIDPGEVEVIDKLSPDGTIGRVLELYNKANLPITYPIKLYLVHEVS